MSKVFFREVTSHNKKKKREIIIKRSLKMDIKKQTILLLSYLVDMNNKLSCDTNELIHSQIFKNQNEIDYFVQNESHNFYLLKKFDNKSFLYIIPVSRKFSDHSVCLKSIIFSFRCVLFRPQKQIALIKNVKNCI